MTVHIEYETENRPGLPYESIAKEVVRETLAYEHCPYEAEVDVLITDNEEIRKLNLEHRGIDKATDVLSFPMVEYQAPGVFDEIAKSGLLNPETGELLLGDIVISAEKLKEQAENYGHTETRELAFLLAHSMLHLLGYDHMEEEERLVMEAKQEEILNRRGYVR